MQQKNTEGERASFLPPWIWCWIIFSLVISFSDINIRRALIDLFFGTYVANPAASEGITHFPFLFRILDITDLWPPLLLAAGLFTIFTPRLRARRLEKAYRLQVPDDTLPAAIVDFIHRYDKNLDIKVNLLRSDEIAFIYPLGYRRSAI
ncbi:MAG TPA: hypothetical protein VEI53_06755, partial [Ktedonobacteraceae bacterium]|nr:hypothetical protein [Ktedonobacteraceae bacterium]